ncbi:cadmium-translocating P-type ATPase [Pelotomaculum terephthalicicum JT]|uniref:heavy metal translocating P-type ATPase n=1 Tax=Pelotomaculum terephthalicicum TaxID=206393 RepID=UPI001F0398A8|nr:cation-translocating P-type ATPase [Pelotomaculum terephthalicicum]MCG9966780.1 cadmium-translocating P-type ATPase [Pelotomaculum terephthalicicum JT]
MIGRFAAPRQFRELLNLREFYLTFAGALLIAASFILEKSSPEPILPALLALAALAVLGGPIIWGAATGLWARELNVDELVSLAMVASVMIGEYLSAAVVAFIMVLGSLLEKYTSQQARNAIQTLVRLKPQTATVLREGIESSLPLEEIQPGDEIVIRPGETIPVDGKVVRGAAAVNQASLTGESLPVDKTAGDSVFAGTASYSGMLVVRVKQVGEETTLGKLIHLVQEAESMRAPVLRVADKYARYFTPLIVAISIAVYLFTGDSHRAITVLIVGCPCAFILAAPTAVTASLGNAARNGVMIKSGAFLEELGRINAVAFDKTGTLTTGKPVLTDVVPAGGLSPEHVLWLAASAEKYSEHPLARAILEAALTCGSCPAEPADFRQIPGAGIGATVEGQKVFVGTASEAAERPPQVMTDGAKTRLVVKADDRVAGWLYITDQIRAGVGETVVPELHRLGVIKTLLLTGDRESVAAHLAKASGIQDYESGLLPEQKLQRIKALQEQGYKVAMVGDGINDAPSLAAADIGIAMGAMGTAVAVDSADIALMTDDLTKIPFALRLGRSTLKTINFNILFAIFFNLLAIILSALGWLNPVTGALAHNIGSVLVVLNSARLIRKRFAPLAASSAAPLSAESYTSAG